MQTVESILETVEEKKTAMAIEMGKYFNSRVTAREFTEWIGKTSYNLFSWEKHNNRRELKDAMFFATSFTWQFLTDLIECKSDEEKDKIVAEGLIWAYGGDSIEIAKRSLQLIGQCNLEVFTNCDFDNESIEVCFNIQSTLVVLLSMYRDRDCQEALAKVETRMSMVA